MTDNVDSQSPFETQGTATDAHEELDHPQAGAAAEGWSSPQSVPGEPSLCLAKLVLKRSGVETDLEYPVNPPTLIGRFDPSIGPIDIDLGTLPEGQYVSRKHAKITAADGVFTVKDLGSSNGTFVLRDDFERVDEAELSDGQELAFGNARFVFHVTCSPNTTTE